MDPKKVAALKSLGLSEDVINELLDLVEQTEKDADAQHVRYKGADGLLKTKEQLISDGLADAIAQVEDSVRHLYERGKSRQALELAAQLLVATKAALQPEPGFDLVDALGGRRLGGKR